ncbi:hypothetical protein F4801DRAFT_41114 [Xylaria longipes]|nr:hypothetical protein F4801DRAFT_41114 [Xylaria longipes]
MPVPCRRICSRRCLDSGHGNCMENLQGDYASYDMPTFVRSFVLLRRRSASGLRHIHRNAMFTWPRHSLFHGDANRYTALSVVVYVSYLRDRRHRRAELLPLKPQTLSHSVLPQHGNEVKIEAQFFTHVAPISGRTPTGTSIVNRDHTEYYT